MSETKVPAIPALNGVTDPQVRTILSALKELIEVRDGRRGDSLDQFVKVRDLTDAGIANFKKRGTGGTGSVLALPDPPDYTTPPALTNFAVTGGYQTMFIEWDYLGPLNYRSFSHVEIWRSPTDEIGSAQILGETTANLLSDPCGSGKTFYYWGRAVSSYGVVGPFNAVHGTVGSTAIDVEYMLEVLTGSITESQLYRDLAARIDLVDDAKAVTTTVNQRLDALYADVENGFVSQDIFNAYVTADAAFAEQVRGMAFVDDSDGRVSALEGVIITQDADRNNTAIRFDAVEASVAGNTARIANEEIARATTDSAITLSIESALSRIGTTEAAIITEQTTRASADSALTSAVNTLSTTVNGNTTSIQTQATTIDGLSGQYTVKIDNNGYVTGFGLASTSATGTPASEFYVRADRFAVGAPGQSKVIPFVVQTTPTVINGVNVPVGVYMDAAYIKNGTITNAKIGNAAIDDAKISSLSAAKVTFGEMLGDRIMVNSLNADRIITNTLAAKLAVINEAYITTANIYDAAITNAKIDRASVNKLSVVSADIANAAITTAKIANAAIDSANIADAAITTAKIGDAAITTAKIDTAAITAAKIGNLEVDTIHLKEGAVTFNVWQQTAGPGTLIGEGGSETLASISLPASTGSTRIVELRFSPQVGPYLYENKTNWPIRLHLYRSGVLLWTHDTTVGAIWTNRPANEFYNVDYYQYGFMGYDDYGYPIYGYIPSYSPMEYPWFIYTDYDCPASSVTYSVVVEVLFATTSFAMTCGGTQTLWVKYHKK